MSDNEIIETAKAVQEASKLGNSAVDGARELGGFFKQVFGDIAEDTVGFVADRVRYMRIVQAAKLQKKVSERLTANGVGQTRPVSPVIGLPILEAASLEEDEELHTAWSNLLTTAMDPSKPEAKRSYAKILSELEPFDASLLARIMIESKGYSHSKSQMYSSALMAKAFGCTDSDIEVSLNNLIRLGLLTYGVVETDGIKFGDYSTTIFRGTQDVSVTSLGVSFYESITY